MSGTIAADADFETSASMPDRARHSSNPLRIPLPRQDEALRRLEYVASRQRGFALLTGPVGSGKTMVLREFAAELRRGSVATVFVDAAAVEARFEFPGLFFRRCGKLSNHCGSCGGGFA